MLKIYIKNHQQQLYQKQKHTPIASSCGMWNQITETGDGNQHKHTHNQPHPEHLIEEDKKKTQNYLFNLGISLFFIHFLFCLSPSGSGLADADSTLRSTTIRRQRATPRSATAAARREGQTLI